MDDGPLLKCGAQRPMQPVLEVQLAFPLHNVSEQVAVERGVGSQERLEVERPLRRDELVEPDLAWRQLRPLTQACVVFGVRAPVTDSFKDHPPQCIRSSLGCCEIVGCAVAEPDIVKIVHKGYAFDVPCIELGALVVDGEPRPDAKIRVPLGMLNRHGLIAGATGTGKTVTLQVMAEQLSRAGARPSRPTSMVTSPAWPPRARRTGNFPSALTRPPAPVVVEFEAAQPRVHAARSADRARKAVPC